MNAQDLTAINRFWKRPFDEELAFRRTRVAELTLQLTVSRQFQEIAPLLSGLTPSNAGHNLESIKIIMTARQQSLEVLAHSLRQYLLPYPTTQRVERDAMEFVAQLGRAQKASARKERALALKTVLEVRGYSIRDLIDFLSGVNDEAIARIEQELPRALMAVDDMLHNGLGPKTEPGGE